MGIMPPRLLRASQSQLLGSFNQGEKFNILAHHRPGKAAADGNHHWRRKNVRQNGFGRIGHGAWNGAFGIGGAGFSGKQNYSSRGLWKFPVGMRQGPFAKAFGGGPANREGFGSMLHQMVNDTHPSRRKVILLSHVANLALWDTFATTAMGMPTQVHRLVEEIVRIAKRGTNHDRRRIFSMFAFAPDAAHRILDEWPYRFRFRDRGMLRITITQVGRLRNGRRYRIYELLDKDQVPRLPGEMPLDITRWDTHIREKFGYKEHESVGS